MIKIKLELEDRKKITCSQETLDVNCMGPIFYKHSDSTT